MIQGLFGTGSIYASLREGMRYDMLESQQLADQIANATNQVPGTPGVTLDPAADVNLEEALVHLVDTTMRFDAESRLLREAYGRLRTAMGGSRG